MPLLAPHATLVNLKGPPSYCDHSRAISSPDLIAVANAVLKYIPAALSFIQATILGFVAWPVAFTVYPLIYSDPACLPTHLRLVQTDYLWCRLVVRARLTGSCRYRLLGVRTLASLSFFRGRCCAPFIWGHSSITSVRCTMVSLWIFIQNLS